MMSRISGGLRALLAAVMLLGAVSLVQAAEKVTVMIRVDDLFSINSPVKPVEIDGFLRVAEKHGARVILATIPNRLLQEVNEGGAMSRALLDYADRGHEIIQHGFNHICEFTGNTGREFSTDEALAGMTQQQRIERLLEGRRLLEAVIGRPVTAYCGVGSDDEIMMPLDADVMREHGYFWLKDAPGLVPVFHPEGGGSYPVMDDYAWFLTEENYAEQLEAAKEYARLCVAEGNVVGLKFHDPFTRAAYEDGLVLRWLDDILSWLEAQPEWEIEYATLGEYRAAHGR